MQDRDSVTALTVNLGLICNVILAALKTSIGILGFSPALLADGVNSTSDAVYYIAVKIFMTQAKNRPIQSIPMGTDSSNPSLPSWWVLSFLPQELPSSWKA